MTPRFSRFLQLTGLNALFVAQPLLDISRQYPDFLVAHGVEPSVLATGIALLLIVPPAILTLATSALALASPKSSERVHVAFVALFAMLGAAQVFREFGSPALHLLLSLFAGSAIGWAYHRYAQLRALLALLSVSSIVFALVFFADPQIRKLMSRQPLDTLQVEIGAPAPVLLWVFDELSLVSLLDEDHRIDPQRFPHIAELSEHATWFPNATTVSDSTVVAVPAILDGLYPVDGERRLAIGSDHPANLFKLLAGSYDTHIVENITQIWPRSVPIHDHLKGVVADLAVVYLHLLASPEMANRALPGLGGAWKGIAPIPGQAADDAPSRRGEAPKFKADSVDRDDVARRSIASIGASAGPALYFLHSMLPHAPWVHLPSGKQYTTDRPPGGVRGLVGDNDDGINTNQWLEDPWPVVQAHQRHLLQVGFVDTLIGEVVARLKEVGFYDKSLIIITADHGIGFTPGQSRRQLNDATLSEILPVPLFIKVPGQTRGAVDPRPVESVDILPSIVDVLEIQTDWRFDGRSVFDLEVPPRTQITAFRGQRQRYSIDAGSLSISALEARQRERFGDGPLSEVLLAHTSPELRNKALANLQIGSDTDLKVRLRSGGVYEKVDLASSYLPLEVSGLIDEPEGPRWHEIAIAINGTVQATTRSATLHGLEDFTSLIPEEALRQGKNTVELFEVSRSDAGAVLHPVQLHRGVFRSERTPQVDHQLQEGEFALETVRGLEHLVDEHGTRIRINDRKLQGWASARVSDDGSFIKFSGLAVDLVALSPVARVGIFANGEFLASDSPYLPRENIARKFDEPNLLHSGYAIALPRERFEPLEDADVRIIVISSRGTAMESAYPENAAWCFQPKR